MEPALYVTTDGERVDGARPIDDVRAMGLAIVAFDHTWVLVIVALRLEHRLRGAGLRSRRLLFRNREQCERGRTTSCTMNARSPTPGFSNTPEQT